MCKDLKFFGNMLGSGYSSSFLKLVFNVFIYLNKYIYPEFKDDNHIGKRCSGNLRSLKFLIFA